MRVQTIGAVVLSLLICTSLAADSAKFGEAPVQDHIKEKLAKLEGTGYGNMLSLLLELGSKDQDYNALFDAFDELLEALSNHSEADNKRFSEASTLHAKIVAELEDSQFEAERDVADATSTLDTLLYPTRQRLHSTIESNSDAADEAEERLERLPREREAEHEEFLQRVHDIDALINAIDEVIDLVDELRNPSLAQVAAKEVYTKKVEALKNKLSNFKGQAYLPVLNALLELCESQNFSDQQALADVTGLLNEIRATLVRQQNQEEDFEDDAQAQFEQDIADTEEALSLYNQIIRDSQEQLVRVQGMPQIPSFM
jgi:ABC-type transporter Mla subunit MlaD